MTAEVEHARRAQADMLAGLRHDLRTPLTVIGGFAQALQDGTASGEEAGRAAAAIADEASRLDRMVTDLGALADLETGVRPLQLEQLDAGLLARDAAERFAPGRRRRRPGGDRRHGDRAAAPGRRSRRGRAHPGQPRAQRPGGRAAAGRPRAGGGGAAARRGGHAGRPRRRSGHPLGRPAARLRALLPRRSGPRRAGACNRPSMSSPSTSPLA